MSKETMETLNRFVLVGNCANRPASWANDPELRARNGWEDNHFDDYIPMSEVVRRLFNWEAVAVPKANLIPVGKKDANFFDSKGRPFRVMMTGDYFTDPETNLEEYLGEKGIVRSNDHSHMATHGSSYRIHDYKHWLLNLQQEIIGDDLKILGAGLLRNGLQAYVQIALPEKIHDDTTGMEFIPYMMAATSLDGSMPTTFSRQGLYVVCDNTRDMALRQSKGMGMIWTAKHTSRSLDLGKIEALRDTLHILVNSAHEMRAENQELAAIKVTRPKWLKVLDIIEPLPKPEDATPTKITRAMNRRELLDSTYQLDPMCALYKGTALGVVHSVNTYWTHYRQINAGERLDRNMEGVIKGQTKSVDIQTVSALSQVLDMPELMPV